jgi:hypothetical protein
MPVMEVMSGLEIADELRKLATPRMQVSGGAGHLEIRWNQDRDEDVSDAKKMFKDLQDKGYRAFRMTKGGGKGEQIDDFDPSAESYVMMPPVRGG